MTLSALFLCFCAFSYEVAEVDQGNKKIAVILNATDKELVKGQALIAKFDDLTCKFDFESINKDKKLIYLDASTCPFLGKIKAGQVLEESAFNHAQANEEKEAKTEEGVTSEESQLKRINESWYFYFGFGLGAATYSNDEVDRALNDLVDNEGYERTTIGLDLLGFYFPFKDQRSAYGFVMSGASDYYTKGRSELRISQYQYSFSVMKFFGVNIGDGFFIRTDLGAVRYNVEAKESAYSYNETSDWGYGFLFGLGYGVAATKETSLLLTLNVASRRVDDSGIVTALFGLGFLF